MRKLFKERKLFKGGNYMRKYGNWKIMRISYLLPLTWFAPETTENSVEYLNNGGYFFDGFIQIFSCIFFVRHTSFITLKDTIFVETILTNKRKIWLINSLVLVAILKKNSHYFCRYYLTKKLIQMSKIRLLHAKCNAV